MARHNDISLLGIVKNAPTIVDFGDVKQGTMHLKVIKGDRDSHDGDVQLKTTFPLIMTKNKKIISIMSNLKENDVIMVKGNIITAAAQKGYTCPHCQTETVNDSIITYINPIDILIYKQNIEDAKVALKYILDNKEFSNEVCVIGHLCNDPEKVITLKSIDVCQYKIGIPRKFHIKEDLINTKADFPFIKSFGENAKNDLQTLKKGSTVLIDGYLQARKFPRQIECSGCGQTYEGKDATLEIVTYHTEYLRNYKNEDKEN